MSLDSQWIVMGITVKFSHGWILLAYIVTRYYVGAFNRRDPTESARGGETILARDHERRSAHE